MSVQIQSNKKLQKLDHVLQHELGILLTNTAVNQDYLEFAKIDLLEEPLIFSTTEFYDFNEMPREHIVEALNLLKQENTQLANTLNKMNKERKALKEQNFQLKERLFCFETFNIEQFDKDFNRFLSKAMFVNYEMSKVFLDKERENAEKLKEVILGKDEEVNSLKAKIQLLEQRVIESRKMLKKTLLETSPLRQKNDHAHSNNGSAQKNPLEFNPQTNRPKESPHKNTSPTSQQDTTSDTLVKTFMHDANKNKLQKREGIELTNHNNFEAQLPTINYERFSHGLPALEDNISEESLSTIRTQGTISSGSTRNRLTEASPSKALQKTTQAPRTSMTKAASTARFSTPTFSQSKTVSKDSLKLPLSQQASTPSSRASFGKKDTKAPTPKVAEIQNKPKSKDELHPINENETLTLSFLLDQNVSVDSINLQMPASSNTVRELENELQRKDGGFLSNNAKIEGRKTLGVPKGFNEGGKIKPKINSSPIPVKKKNQNRDQNQIQMPAENKS